MTYKKTVHTVYYGMNWDTLNLDIGSYSDNALRRLFGARDPIGRVNVIKIQLNSKRGLSPEQRAKFTEFLNKAIDRLSIAASNEGTWAETTVPVVEAGGTTIIDNPNAIAGRTSTIVDGRAAGGTEAPPGWLNPLNVRTVHHTLNIDSTFRAKPLECSSTHFSIELPSTIPKVTRITVCDVKIPLNPLYQITGDEPTPGNSIWIYGVTPLGIDGTPRATLFRHTLPPGFYPDVSSVCSALTVTDTGKWVFNEDNGSVFYAQQGSTLLYVLCVDPSDYGIDLSDHAWMLNQFTTRPADLSDWSADDSLQKSKINESLMRKIGSDIQNSLGWKLGFREPITHSQFQHHSTSLSPLPADPPYTFVVGAAPARIFGPDYGYLALDDHAGNTGSSFTPVGVSGAHTANVIARFDLSRSWVKGDTQLWSSLSSSGSEMEISRSREYFGPVDISKLTCTLLDATGKELSLFGANWSAVIVVERMYT